MAQFTRQRVRIAVDVALKKDPGSIRDAITSNIPKFARAAGVQFEIALFNNGTLITDISNIPVVTLEIKQSNDPDAVVAMTKTIGPSSMNGTLTQQQWTAGDPAHCHFLFQWLGTETVDSVFGSPDDETPHWLVLWGYTSDASTDRDVFAVGTVQSFDAGIDGTVAAPPASEDGVSLTQVLALLQAYLKKDNESGVSCTFRQGTKAVKIGCDSNGELYIETQATT